MNSWDNKRNGATIFIEIMPFRIFFLLQYIQCAKYSVFPQWLSSKESVFSAGDTGSIPESGRIPGEGNGKPLQYSSLGNPMDREDWWATVHGVAKELDMT